VVNIYNIPTQSQAGGCKIICQHDDPTIIHSKGKSEKQHPRAWFLANIIGVDKDQSEQLDWNTKKFKPLWTYKQGTDANSKNSKFPSSETVGKQWMANWRMQKYDKSAVSKLSSTNESVETICLQLTSQHQENIKLMTSHKNSKTMQNWNRKNTNSKWVTKTNNGRITQTRKLPRGQTGSNRSNKIWKQQPTKP
jgi:hypothetical protein